VYWGAGREHKQSGVVWRAMERPPKKEGSNDGVGSHKTEMSSNALGTVSVLTTRTFAFRGEVPDVHIGPCVLLLAGQHRDFEHGSPGPCVVEVFAHPSFFVVDGLAWPPPITQG